MNLESMQRRQRVVWLMKPLSVVILAAWLVNPYVLFAKSQTINSLITIVLALFAAIMVRQKSFHNCVEGINHQPENSDELCLGEMEK